MFNQNTFGQIVSKINLQTIDNIINESIFISTNSCVFLTGETLLYKLSCLNKTTNKISSYTKVAYVELIDSNKKTIIKQKLFLENASASADIFLATTLSTGNYKMIGYTKWMTNKTNPDLFVKDITIINPYNKLDDKKITINQDTIKNNTTAVKNTAIIKITTNKKNYTNRELVLIDLKKNLESNLSTGNYSLSINKVNNLLYQNNTNSISFSKLKSNTDNIGLINNDNIPELRGEIISGQIKSKSRKKVNERQISLSIPNENYTFKTTKTNKDGVFNFVLDTKNTSQNIIIQIIDKDKEDFIIEMLENKSPNYESLQFEKFKINSNTKNYIQQKAISSQIENAYFETKKDSIIPVAKKESFYKKLATEFILDNYTKFPTLKETIVEVVEGLYASSKNKNYSLYLKDFDLNNKLDIPALVIVDGLYIQDINDLIDHKAELFYKIDIIKGGYYYGSKLFNGLVSFTTRNFQYENKLKGDFIINPDILRPIESKNYYQPDYKVGNNLVRIPDFREQLLWNPNISLNQDFKPTSFYTSDVTGEFEIILEGFTSDGIPVYEREVFKVENN